MLGRIEPHSPHLFGTPLRRIAGLMGTVRHSPFYRVPYRAAMQSLYYYMDDAYEEGPSRVLSPEAVSRLAVARCNVAVASYGVLKAAHAFFAGGRGVCQWGAFSA